MIDRLGHIIIAVLLCLSAPLALAAESYDSTPDTDRLDSDLSRVDAVDLAAKTDAALDTLIATAGDELDARGFSREATGIRMGWQPLRGALARAMRMGDIGDHAALSEFLRGLYWEQHGVATGRLVDLLGQELCEFLHLNDLFYINAGIPVSFHLASVTEAITAGEYALHFVPMSGAVAYWTVWAVCSAATWGSGVGFVCTPAGMLARRVTVRRIAPRWSPRFYGRFYP